MQLWLCIILYRDVEYLKAILQLLEVIFATRSGSFNMLVAPPKKWALDKRLALRVDKMFTADDLRDN